MTRKNAWTHSASGFQNHGCRCAVCRSDWEARYVPRQEAALKLHPRVVVRKVVTVPVSTTRSWWTEVPVGAMTATAKQEQDRMRASKFAGKTFNQDDA